MVPKLEVELTANYGGVQAELLIDGVGGRSGQPPGGEGGGTATYVCAGNTLVIDPEFENPFWPYPRTWTQVER